MVKVLPWYDSLVRIYGLTGGIASGKSTVARLLREHGAHVVDADLLARAVVAPGSEALQEIEAHFGSQMLLPSGELDRKALGAVVFADPSARAELDAITHPRIAQAGHDAMAALAQQGESLAFYEAALLVENNLQHDMDGLIVVAIPRDVQLQRLQARDEIDLDEAQARLEAQLPLADKLLVANFVIDNVGSESETAEQVLKLWLQLNALRE